MEANGSLSQDNSGFSPDVSSATAPPPRALPKSTYSLLECPVCLELAWPPKRIYQVMIAVLLTNYRVFCSVQGGPYSV